MSFSLSSACSRTLRHLALLLVAAPPLAAQQRDETIDTPMGPCVIWAMPTGSSTAPRDASYRRCALDRPPILQPGQAMPPSPRFFGGAGSSCRIVVNPDGLVDSSLTRPSTATQDVVFHEEALAAIKGWRFEPGLRAGVPVRSTIDLEVGTDTRASDTVPARLEWRYVRGPEKDTLSGRWISEPPLPPFASEQVDSVHAATLRQLSTIGVLRPTATRSYCLGWADTAASDRDRLVRLARQVRRDVPGLGAGACVDTPQRVRLLLPRVHHTENGRAVVYMSGAQLPSWPAGFDARPWARWKSRCVGVVRGRETVPMTCDVEPDTSWDARRRGLDELRRRRPAARVARADGEPVDVMVLATMTGAYGVDTLRTRLARVPSFRDVAQTDTLASRDSWFVWSPVRSDSTAFVVHGDVMGDRLFLTRAQYDRQPEWAALPARPMLPDATDRFAAFLLGGVGARPRAPLTLCFGSCARRYVVDARQHTLQPIIRFRVGALRAMSRSQRGQLELRVVVDPVPDGLVPMLVITGPGGRTSEAMLLRDIGGGVWDWHVTYGGSDWPSREAQVYLVRR